MENRVEDEYEIEGADFGGLECSLQSCVESDHKATHVYMKQ